MAESLSRWESDPLFSAAEIVQDSADRMESVYRMMQHEQKLVQGCPADSKTLISMQYHRRDLATALETTRWQLEDLERAVDLAALSDNSNSRENAIFKFRQFVGAIKEQIDQVERAVKDMPMVELNGKVSISSDDHDSNGLALFLSGGDSNNHDVHKNSGRSIMKRFLNSATGSEEIIEIQNEVDLNPRNGLSYASNCYANGGGGSQYEENKKSIPAFNQECGTSTNYDLEYGTSSANSYPYKGWLNGLLWRVLRKFVRSSRSSATKRRKDGEIADKTLEGAGTDTSLSLEQDYLPLMGWVQVPNIQRFRNALHFHSSLEAIHRRLSRTHYLVFCSQRMVRVTVFLLVVLITLGYIAFHNT